MKVYDENNIDELKEKKSIYDYFKPLIKEGVEKYIDNINCNISLLEIDENIIPIVITDKNWDDSLYTSLFSHFISYTIHEIDKIHSPIIKHTMKFTLKLLGKYLKSNKINKTIYVNNWLISTNLYPNLTAESIAKIMQYLTQEYKDYAIVFKNICKNLDKDIAEILKNEQCNFIVNRQIFYTDTEIKSKLKNKYTNKIKKDFKLLTKNLNSGFKLTEAKNRECFLKIHKMYHDLYIKKYSIYNPKYTPEYFELVSQNELFELKVLKDEKEILGMTLAYKNNNTFTVPAIGYDMSKEIDLGLYRMLAAYLNHTFEKKYTLFHQSAGVGDYKMQRGAKPSIEYMAIYYKHLKLNRRVAYKILEKVVNFTIPILCKKKLCGFVPNKP